MNTLTYMPHLLKSQISIFPPVKKICWFFIIFIIGSDFSPRQCLPADLNTGESAAFFVVNTITDIASNFIDKSILPCNIVQDLQNKSLNCKLIVLFSN